MSTLHLLVRVGAERYAVRVADVLEVARFDGLTRVPGAPPAVIGIRNLRGRLMPVIDLAAVLEVSRAGSPAAIVIVERAGHPAGLAVEALIDVEPVATDTTEADGLVVGSAMVDGALIGILDVARMLRVATGVAP